MKSLALVLCFSLLPAAALAKSWPHADAKVTIDIPDSWKVEPDGDALNATSPDETAALIFVIVPADTLQKAADEIDKELDKIVKDVTMEDGKETTLNGMKAWAADGKGKADGKGVDIGVAFIQTKSGKILLVLGFGETGKYEKHEADISKILQSIKPQ